MNEVTKVYIVIEDHVYDGRWNVACLGTKEEAEAFVKKLNADDILKSFTYEEWEIGKTIYD